MINRIASVILSATLVAASAAHAQGPSVPATPASNNTQTFLEFQVESPAKIKSHAAPEYPDHLRRARIEGEVLVQFIVDETGNARMESFKVIRSNDNAFTESVKKAVSQMTFIPAELQGKKVRQLVQQPYRFKP